MYIYILIYFTLYLYKDKQIVYLFYEMNDKAILGAFKSYENFLRSM